MQSLIEKIQEKLWMPDPSITSVIIKSDGYYYEKNNSGKYLFLYSHPNYKFIEDDSRSKLLSLGIQNLPINKSIRKFNGTTVLIASKKYQVYYCNEHDLWSLSLLSSKNPCKSCLSSMRSELSKKSYKTQIEKYGQEKVDAYFSKNPKAIEASKNKIKLISKEERKIKWTKCGEIGIQNSIKSYEKFKHKYSTTSEYTFLDQNWYGWWDENLQRILYHFKCNLCNTTFSSALDKISCPKCNPPYFKTEEEIRKLTNGERLRFRNSSGTIKEIDSYIKDLRFGIEYNGIMFHSTNYLRAFSQNKHQEKSLFFAEMGIKLIHISEDIWIKKKQLVISFIEHKLNKSLKIYARKCKICLISSKDSYEFCNSHHFQGGKHSKVCIGLFHDDELISILTFNPHSKYEWEIDRYATKSKYIITGGFSKMLSFFESLYSPKSIFTYQSIDLNNIYQDSVYFKNGFKFIGITPPSYWYINLKTMERYSRVTFQKHKLKDKFPHVYSSMKSETEIMIEAGYAKYYDSGNFKFIKENK